MPFVVAGQRVGRVNIGASRQIVINDLGEPQQTRRSSVTGLRRDTYLGSQPANELRRAITIVYSGPTSEQDRVVQIEFNSPDFETSDGISTNSSIDEFRATHPNAALSLFEYPNEETGIDVTHLFFDDTQEGITYQLLISAELARDAVFIRIHARNAAVLPDPGGEAGMPPESLS